MIYLNNYYITYMFELLHCEKLERSKGVEYVKRVAGGGIRILFILSAA